MNILTLLLGLFSLTTGMSAQADVTLQHYPVPSGAHPHDVAPDPKGGVVWYTAQHQGALGMLDPATGNTRHIDLGTGSSPHGVIVGPDGAPWVTDSGLNAIVRVDPETFTVKTYPLPQGTGYANLNTAAFDANGTLWFTGQSGIYGSLNPQNGKLRIFDAPHGRGPYGIAATPRGDIYYASLAGSHIAKIDTRTGEATVLTPPTQRQGARRVWADSKNRIWVSEWNSGQLSLYDPATKNWRSWSLPGNASRTYAVYVDEKDKVWVSDFGANALLRFDPLTETFEAFPSPRRGAAVRQILGRAGEVWVPESGTDYLVVYRTGSEQAKPQANK